MWNAIKARSQINQEVDLNIYKHTDTHTYIYTCIYIILLCRIIKQTSRDLCRHQQQTDISKGLKRRSALIAEGGHCAAFVVRNRPRLAQQQPKWFIHIHFCFCFMPHNLITCLFSKLCSHTPTHTYINTYIHIYIIPCRLYQRWGCSNEIRQHDHNIRNYLEQTSVSEIFTSIAV